MKAKRALLSVIAVISYLMALMFGVISFCVGIAGGTVVSDGFYADTVTEKGFSAELKERIDKILADDCAVYGIPYDAIKDSITEEELAQTASRYAVLLYEGKDSEGIGFPKENIEKAVKDYIDSLSDPTEKKKFGEDYPSLLAGRITERIDGNFASVTDQKLIQKVLEKTVKNEYVLKAVRLLPVFIGLNVIFLCALFAAKKGSVIRKALITSSALFVTSSFCFAPCLLLKGGNVPERMAIADSYLRQFAVALLGRGIDVAFAVSAVAFGVSLVLLVVFSVLAVSEKRKRKEEEEEKAENVTE